EDPGVAEVRVGARAAGTSEHRGVGGERLQRVVREPGADVPGAIGGGERGWSTSRSIPTKTRHPGDSRVALAGWPCTGPATPLHRRAADYEPGTGKLWLRNARQNAYFATLCAVVAAKEVVVNPNKLPDLRDQTMRLVDAEALERVGEHLQEGRLLRWPGRCVM